MAWEIIRTKGKLIFWGDSGLTQNNLVATVTPLKYMSPLYILNFADSLNPHTLCTIPYAVNMRTYGNGIESPGTGANIDKKAVLYFRDPTDLSIHTFTYPCPPPADIEETGYGTRIKNSVVADIVSWINIFTGKSFEPLYGIYYQRV